MRHRSPSAAGISLESLLRRRRVSLTSFLEETGVTTYEFLLQRCERMGVTPPPKHVFETARPTRTSSPTEGVIVMEPPIVISASTGEQLDVEEETIPELSGNKDKKRKKKTRED